MIIKHVKLSPSDLCNLSCQFCPRGHPEIYPNNNEHMTMDTFRKILDDISVITSNFYFEVCGNGEPTISKNFKKITEELYQAKKRYPNMITRLVSNGAKFNQYKEEIKLYDQVIIDVYTDDDEVWYEQVQKWRHLNILRIQMINQYGKMRYLYDGHNGEIREVNGAMLLNSRANAFEIPLLGPLNPPSRGRCEKPHRDITFNHRGDYILCHEDWHGGGLGNVHEESIYDFYHYNKRFVQYKNDLDNGIRIDICEGCSYPGNNKHMERYDPTGHTKDWYEKNSKEWEDNITDRYKRQAALPDYPEE